MINAPPPNRRVFVTQYNSNFSYEKTSTFGRLVPVTTVADEIAVGLNVVASFRAMDTISEILSDFDPNNDILLLTGDPAIIAMSLHYLGSMGHQKIPMLKWDARMKLYFRIESEVQGGIRKTARAGKPAARRR